MSSGSDTSAGIKKILPKWMSEPSTYTIKPRMFLGAAAFVVFSIVLIGMYIRTLGDIDAGLYGFWNVDGDFAEKAHLDTMYMYIGAPKNNAKNSIGIFGCEIPIYVFLKADDVVRFNKIVKSYVRRRTLRTDSLQKYSIDFGAPVSIIPKEISAEYDHVTQMLVLRDSKRIYARMFKKSEISFYCTSSSMASLGKTSSTHQKNLDHDEDESQQTGTDDKSEDETQNEDINATTDAEAGDTDDIADDINNTEE